MPRFYNHVYLCIGLYLLLLFIMKDTKFCYWKKKVPSSLKKRRKKMFCRTKINIFTECSYMYYYPK